MMDLPESDEAIAQWCRDMFVAKDVLLDKHTVEDTFRYSELQETGRSIKSLLVVICWTSLIAMGTLKFLQWSELLSSLNEEAEMASTRDK